MARYRRRRRRSRRVYAKMSRGGYRMQYELFFTYDN